MVKRMIPLALLLAPLLVVVGGSLDMVVLLLASVVSQIADSDCCETTARGVLPKDRPAALLATPIGLALLICASERLRVTEFHIWRCE
jgi:hypothetical protein